MPISFSSARRHSMNSLHRDASSVAVLVRRSLQLGLVQDEVGHGTAENGGDVRFDLVP